MDDNKIITDLIKSLRRANRHTFGKESVSEIVAFLKSENTNNISTIKDAYYDIVDYLAIKKGDELTAICSGADRMRIELIIDILISVNYDKIASLSPEKITQKINAELAKNGSTFKITISPNIASIIYKIKTMEGLKRAARLVSVYDIAVEVYQYSKKFLDVPVSDLRLDLETLEKNIGEIKMILFDDDKAKQIAISYLSQKGYPAVALNGKDAGELLKIMGRHYMAALSVLFVKLANSSRTITNKNDVIDATALFLLDQQDLTNPD